MEAVLQNVPVLLMLKCSVSKMGGGKKSLLNGRTLVIFMKSHYERLIALEKGTQSSFLSLSRSV